MTFSDETKIKTLSIISVFETSKPLGNFSAYAVLDDGAGVSFGIAQFTHRSGSLSVVVEEYLARGGQIARTVLERSLPILALSTPAAIAKLAADRLFEKALKAAAVTREMRAAQGAVLDRLYLRPAIAECGQLGFELPLSFAVVCDSLVHGSWAMLRDSIKIATPATGGEEKQWITAYVRKRHAWLRTSPRLAKTAYRTRFFLTQIMLGGWNLDLPMNVHGVRLTSEALFPGRLSGPQVSAAEPSENPPITSNGAAAPANTQTSARIPARSAQTPQPPNSNPGTEILGRVEHSVGRAARNYDRFEAVVKTVITRRDAAKSLWTTIVAAAWQTAWAVAGFVCNIPRVVWLTAAILTAAIALAYLYRQIALGKIRERENRS